MNLRFLYRNGKGETKEYEVSDWSEVGNYIDGFCLGAQALRTFRKDRVIEYFDAGASLLADPHPIGPPSVSRPATREASTHSPSAPQVLFTGFPASRRIELETQAASAGLHVSKTVTKGLTFLCAGLNAGPAKVSRAREQRVYILSEEQFHSLLETGELPDEQ